MENEFTEYLNQAMAWYEALKTKENKTPIEISVIIKIEQIIHLEILNAYQNSINEK